MPRVHLLRFRSVVPRLLRGAELGCSALALAGCSGPGSFIVPVTCVAIPRETRPAVLFQAVALGAQDLQLSLIDPNPDSVRTLREFQEWSTDSTELSRADIVAHNARYPTVRLPLDRRYAVGYRGSYSAPDSTGLSFSIHALLFARGDHSRYEPYPEMYSDEFFASRIGSRIVQHLPASARVMKCDTGSS